ncbi:MAG: hypothetical protein QM662_06705 [Gordonia sp. (in: high G+C Gram-positive bacteria)]
MLTLAGCASDPEPRQTVTVYASPSAPAARTSGVTVPSSSADAMPASNASLRAGFERAVAGTGLRVGLAAAPVGGDSAPTIQFGDTAPGVAWSTIKVPVAIAAERENGPSGDESNAIINSDNAAAESLWASLGTDAEASRKVMAVLREGGNPDTLVPSEQLRAGFTVFGQTQWALPAAATFAGHLPCMPGTEHVIELMGQVAGNQQWGAEIMRAPRSTAVKGGWGPSPDGSYLVRQLGLITYRDGRQTAVAMSATGGSMSDGIAALNVVGNWLNRNIGALPRGRC